MKKTYCRTGAIPCAALMGAMLAILPGAAWAQNAATATPNTPPATGSTSNQARMRTLDVVVTQISRGSGVMILADSSVVTQSVPLPKDVTTPDNFEAQLDAVVKALPPGATWAKVYLPISSSARRLDPDAVTDYVMAQAHLFGNVGAATPAGTIEIMGQKVTTDKAASVISTLNLKPVYLITSAKDKSLSGDPTQQNWTQLTPEQRQQAASQQAQQILNMDPQNRTAYFQQQMATMQAMIQQMTPEQRQQMMQSFGAMGGGGMGGGRGGRGGRGGQ